MNNLELVRQEIESIKKSLAYIEVLLRVGAGKDNQAMLTVPEAANLFGIHINSLHRVLQANLIHHERVRARGGGRGGAYRIAMSDAIQAQPHIRRLISEARRILDNSEEG